MKQIVEIEVDIPEGYKVTGYGIPKRGDTYLCNGVPLHASGMEYVFFAFILEKIEPRRRIFECISEEPRRAVKGEWFENGDSLNLVEGSGTLYTYKIWREVDESEES